MLSTKKLAEELNLVERIYVTENGVNPYSIQIFSYLIVLDFEATCTETKEQFLRAELIEFAAVLYDVKKGEILVEFQQYVMPTENPKLTEFCIGFTGISQETVDNGVPVGTCLMLFDQWIKKQEETFNIILKDSPNQSSNCAFVTWTNWDLGTCLNNECKRKRIIFRDYFKRWIDLKKLYKEYYCRAPKGLEGALNEVGRTFEGKQHCGLDDAKNTAFLAGRMIADGALLTITKNI